MDNEIMELAARILSIDSTQYETDFDALQDAQWLAGKIFALASQE